MATTFLKNRWAAWENSCIQKAFNQKIEQKIMAIALGRTVPSISKKIQKLGLRVPSSLRGRIKGQKQTLPRTEKLPSDVLKMTKILKDYAPLEFFQKSELALNKRRWTTSKALFLPSKKVRKRVDQIKVSNASFSFVSPLEFIPSKAFLPAKKGEQKYATEAMYVPLHYVEQWADSIGFHKMTGKLEENGLSYWKNGTYFSRTQLLMHVNRLRYDHNLQPLALLEEEDLLA